MIFNKGKRYLCVFIVLLIFNICSAQSNKLGGPCQGCEAIYETNHQNLSPVDTLPQFDTALQKIKITGTVYKIDGKTPAKNVIIYVYHTNEKGIYPKKTSSKGWEKKHGFIRGWVKTDASGAYTFYTFKPASYPNTTIEQHIHFTIKEPFKREYYISDITFNDDPNLSSRTKNRKNPRGGKGIVLLKRENGILVGYRNIILGQNIPNYN